MDVKKIKVIAFDLDGTLTQHKQPMVDANKMLEAMNDAAMVQRNMFALSQKLQTTCYAINARTARYTKKAS